MTDSKSTNSQCKGETSRFDREKEKNIETSGSHGGKTSYLSTLFHILAVSVGPIVFSIPLAFDMVGYVSSIIGIFLVGFCYAYNLRLYLKCCQKLCDRRKIDHLTFADSVRFSLEDSPFHLQKTAPFAGHFINALMLLTWGGELAFNVIFICLNMQHIAEYYGGKSIDVRFVVLCSALPCTLISSIPRLKLSILSIVAGTIDLIFLGFILGELYFNPHIRNASNNIVTVQTLDKIPNFLAFIFFTLNFSGIVLPLKSEMKNKEKFDSKFGLITTAVTIICLVDVAFGLLGYLRYGQKVSVMITLNLPVSDVFIQIMIALYCLAIFFSYPVYFLVVFRTVWDAWVPTSIKKSESRDLYETLMRVVLNIVLFLLMYIFPQISLFTNIGGLICAIINSLIIPSAVQILLSDEIRKCRWIIIVLRNFVFVSIGVVLLYFGLIECFKAIKDGRI